MVVLVLYITRRSMRRSPCKADSDAQLNVFGVATCTISKLRLDHHMKNIMIECKRGHDENEERTKERNDKRRMVVNRKVKTEKM